MTIQNEKLANEAIIESRLDKSKFQEVIDGKSVYYNQPVQGWGRLRFSQSESVNYSIVLKGEGLSIWRKNIYDSNSHEVFSGKVSSVGELIKVVVEKCNQ